jgi:predicted lysophospholipase L1 biosynthesis ABC-type transport system permease subunit
MRHRALALAQFVALALSLAVPLCLRMVQDGAAQAGYQSLLTAGSAAVIIEEPRIASADRFAEFQQRTAQLVNGQVGADLMLATTYTRASSFRINTQNLMASAGDANLTASYYPDLLTHAALVNGVWPDGKGLQSPIPVAFSQTGAAQAGLAVGDVVCVGTKNTSKDRSWCMKLVGTWQALKPGDLYWQSGPSNTDITLSGADYFQFLAAANNIANDVSFRAGTVYQPDPARFTVAHAPSLADGLTQLRGQVEIRQGGSFGTSLDHAIRTFLERTRVSQFPIQLVGASLLLVMAYALGLLSHSYLDSQLQQSLLWRTRGTRRERIAGFLLAQMGILLVPAILLAVALALAATWFLLSHETGASAPLNILPASLSTGLGIGLALVLIVETALIFRFSRRSVLEMRRALTRPSTVAWWRWRNIDLGLALLAIPLLAEVQLRSQVAVRGASSGPDLVGLALPVVALAVLGLAGLRLLPLLANACALAPKNLAARLSWLRMSRQPTEHAGLALLLALAVAIGAFAGIYSATERQNVVDRVAYNVGADLRVRYIDRALPDAISNDLAKIEKVTSATKVLRQTVQVSNSSLSITALGVDTRSFLATAWTREGLSSPALGPALTSLTQRDSQGPGLPIPVLMSQATMLRLGIKNGFDFYFYIGSHGFKAVVVGTLDYVPTLYPGVDDFMVMTLDRALAVAADNPSFTVAPNELWVNLQGDHRAAIAPLLRDPSVAFVLDRNAEQADALGDPLFLGLQANLAIGFGTALALAALAFAVHFLIAARRRLSEHAILEANGLEPGVVRTGIAIEQGIVVLFALAVGCALALILIVWLLPSLQLGSGASDLVPPTVLSADWRALGIGALLTVALAGALAWAIRRAGTSVDTMEELRRLG